MDETYQILKKFCLKKRYNDVKDERLKTIGEPFSIDGHTYATDGHILVRLKGLYAKINKSAPNAHKVFNFKEFSNTDVKWININKNNILNITKHPDIECPVCTPHQKETIVMVCENCGGEGYEECDLGYEHECNFCTDGYIKKIINPSDCWECLGARVKRNNVFTIKQKDYTTYLFVGFIILFLENFKNIKISTTREHGAVMVKFDEGEGLIMAMRLTNKEFLNDHKEYASCGENEKEKTR